MVTFLVCLVVVGGASIIILRVTLEDVFKGATDDPASHGGAEPPALGGTASSSRPPAEHDATDHLGDPTASTAPTEPEGTEQAGTEQAGAEPHRARTAEAELPAVPVDGPSSPVLPAPGRTAGADPETPEQQIALREEAPTSAVLVEERPTEVHSQSDEAHTATMEAPAPVGPRRSAPRALRPSFRRRLSRRVLGGVKLLVLLVVIGALLALVLGAVAVLFTLAMRAAIGS